MIANPEYAFVVMVLGCLMVTGLLVMVVAAPASLPAPPRRRPALALLRRQAELLDVDPTVWTALLVAAPAAAVSIGLAGGLPPAVVAVMGLIGGAAIPWFSGFRRDTVLQRREDAVVAMAKDMADRVRGAALNQVVRSLGQRPPDRLRRPMTVLADIDRPVEDCLAECARRSGSALMTRFCVYVAVGLKADTTVFRELLPTTVIPHLEGLLRQQKARKRTLAYQRGVITIMATVLVALFTILYTLGPAFHDFYGTRNGGLTIAAVVAGFCALVGLVHVVLRAPRRPSWDLEVLNRELAKY